MSSNGPANTAIPTKHSNGYYLQAMLSFGISIAALLIGIVYIDVEPWVRGFLAMGLLFCISSTITISKVVRDREEAASVLSRADAARLERMLAEYDPLQPLSMGAAKQS